MERESGGEKRRSLRVSKITQNREMTDRANERGRKREKDLKIEMREYEMQK